MSFGLVEVITLLLGLSGFGIQANPRAPTADQSLQYAMPDPDVVVHIDAASLIPGNYKLLTGLPNQPAIKASPELAKLVRKTIAEADSFRGVAKTMTGIDVTTDISDATMFVQMPTSVGGPPTLLIAVRGKFNLQTIDKIAKITKPATRLGGGAMIEIADGSRPSPVAAIAVTRDGVLLAGDTKLVKDRLADTWKAPARAVSSSLAHAADAINAKPVFAVSLTMSASARKLALQDLPPKNFLTDLIVRHKLLAFSIHRDGIGWTWIDSHKAGLDAMAQMSEGTMEILKAAQIAPRGMAKILMGGLESYRGTNKQVDELLRRKADIWKVMESYTGDGNFKVQIDKNSATLRLTARATGKSLSEVVPAGFFIPAGMVAWLTVGGAEPQPPMQIPAPSSTTPRPALSPTPRTGPPAGTKPAAKPAPKPAPRP
ncbi:MAG: hypothetical protein H0T89_36645 [Deltaproteobacteria bacterium]|nr:hypothetical protein [Deltaproteobacteria bacterium]MDQ3297816.1 hypothetical protein [Myxococcota bacterium]